jgi:cytochrome oxidase Cu insertion factor (SCO1/SenC/PrrC family)
MESFRDSQNIALLAARQLRSPEHHAHRIDDGNKQFGTNFALPDTGGKIRTLADFKGKAVILFFGYTHCPDVCPTTMAELSHVRIPAERDQ